jgi:hypothetical protein
MDVSVEPAAPTFKTELAFWHPLLKQYSEKNSLYF